VRGGLAQRDQRDQRDQRPGEVTLCLSASHFICMY